MGALRLAPFCIATRQLESALKKISKPDRVESMI